MPKIRVTLSIGFAGAVQEEEIDIEEEDWNECETERDKQKLMDSYWQDWSSNYINGGYELIE